MAKCDTKNAHKVYRRCTEMQQQKSAKRCQENCKRFIEKEKKKCEKFVSDFLICQKEKKKRNIYLKKSGHKQ